MTALLGIWFVIMGLFEIVSGFMLRRMVRTEQAAPAGSTGSAVRTAS